MKLGIDLETFSPENLKLSGLYQYALNPEFDILLFGYSLDGEAPVVLDCTKTNDRLELMELAPLIYNPGCIKTAYNAAFEWYCLSVYLNRYKKLNGLLPIDQWRDTQLAAQYCGYPTSLEDVGRAMQLPEDKKKLATGKTLIRLFCSPRKPAKRDQRTRIYPEDEPEKWELFKTYNAGDVISEQEIARRLEKWPVPDFVQKQWELDTLHNAMGVNIDMKLVNGAISIADRNTKNLLDEAAEITGLDNPNSRDQLKDWLTKELPEDDVPDMKKETVSGLLKNVSTEHVKRVLEIRQETGKAAYKKYARIKSMVCADGRVRGMMKFYGANRTGRWCIAEGSLVKVKTSTGEITEKPIESVLITDLVWDGTDWVKHDGVVARGIRNVITWDGVTATPDHEVWVSPYEKIPLSDAMSRKIKLWSGDRLQLHKRRTKSINAEKSVKKKTYDILNAGPKHRFMVSDRIVSNCSTGVQLQNLARTHVQELDFARSVVEAGDLDALKFCYGAVSDTLGQLVRTALIPSPGHVFVDADFSAIEARVIAWLAGEEWVLEVFRTHGKIYEATASQMFGVPMEKIKKGNPEYELRQRGKVATLALGYQGGPNALTTMDTGHVLHDDEKPGLVKKWRQANPAIVKYWYDTENAALETLRTGQPHKVRYCTYAFETDEATGQWFLTCLLPSGRKLFYARPTICENRFGKQAIRFWGVNDKKKWGEIDTYGGRLVENQCQAVARDCLAEKLYPLERAGYPVVFSIHDEIIADVPENYADLKTVTDIMSAPISWAPGLPLNAEGWVGKYFKKD